MKYADFLARGHFEKPELLAFAHGRLVEDPPAGFATRLPLPPMLMIDRVLEISRSGSRGRIVAERDVNLDDWFFQSHFLGDPVQPGCLGSRAAEGPLCVSYPAGAGIAGGFRFRSSRPAFSRTAPAVQP